MSGKRGLARLFRWVTVHSFYNEGAISREDAEKLLSGELSPGDESTVFDDSALLNDPSKAIDLIRESEM
jgi:hypothetical protein